MIRSLEEYSQNDSWDQGTYFDEEINPNLGSEVLARGKKLKELILVG
jgi:hypothetical protein